MLRKILLLTLIPSLAALSPVPKHKESQLTEDAIAALVVASLALAFAVLLFCRMCYLNRRKRVLSEDSTISEAAYPSPGPCLHKYDPGVDPQFGQLDPPPPYHLTAEPGGGRHHVTRDETHHVTRDERANRSAPEYPGEACSEETSSGQLAPPLYETLGFRGNDQTQCYRNRTVDHSI